MEKSSMDDYDGINRFDREECRYLLSFTEYLYDVKKDDYAVSFVNFSDKEESRRPRFLADFISVGKHVQKEKLRDCLDLIDIMISEEFIFELCAPNGELQYLLPADRCVFRADAVLLIREPAGPEKGLYFSRNTAREDLPHRQRKCL